MGPPTGGAAAGDGVGTCDGGEPDGASGEGRSRNGTPGDDEPADGESGDGTSAPHADPAGSGGPLGSAAELTALGEGVRASREEGTVEQVATRALRSYRDARDCVLAGAGYVDLLGHAWVAIVQGDGWVEVCLVVQEQDVASCEVSVLRLEGDEAYEGFGEVPGEGDGA